MNLSKELKVGAISVFAILMLVWGYNYLKGTNIFFKNTSVYTIFPQISGLAVSSPVVINGVRSGVVEDIYFHPDKSSRVIVKFSIEDNGLFIPNNSIAELASLDIMGSVAIKLALGNSKIPVNVGDTLISDKEKSMIEGVTEQFSGFKEKAEGMMSTFDSTAKSFNRLANKFDSILDTQRQQDLKRAISSLNNVMLQYGKLANNLNYTITNNVNPTLNSFKNLSDSLSTLNIKGTLHNAEKTLSSMSSILNKIEQGEGTLGQLVKNDSLYKNLEAVTKDMDLLLINVKENPKRYVHFSLFGRKEKK